MLEGGRGGGGGGGAGAARPRRSVRSATPEAIASPPRTSSKYPWSRCWRRAVRTRPLLRRREGDRAVLDLVLFRARRGPALRARTAHGSWSPLHQPPEQPDRIAARG